MSWIGVVVGRLGYVHEKPDTLTNLERKIFDQYVNRTNSKSRQQTAHYTSSNRQDHAGNAIARSNKERRNKKTYKSRECNKTHCYFGIIQDEQNTYCNGDLGCP